MSLHFKTATPDDAGLLGEFFLKSYRETFGHLYDPADLAAFFAEHSTAQWERQLSDEDFAIWIAEEGKDLAGYVKLAPVELPIDLQAPALEIRQFYVGAKWQGAGVAAALMDRALTEARGRGAEDLYLSVYTDNQRAQRFYARFGFVIVGRNAFMVGNQADEDVIMKLAL